MSLIQSLQKFVPLGPRKPALPRGQALALKPVRNSLVEWDARPDDEDAAGGLRLRVPRREDRWSRLLGYWLAYPTHKIIELDEFGAAIWERCDGAHTVEHLAAHTSETYKLNRRQAEVSVIAFLKMLTQRRLIGFLAPQVGQAQGAKGKETHGNTSTQRQRRARRVARRH